MATSGADEGTERIDSHTNRGGYFLVLTDECVTVSQRGQEISRLLLEDMLGVETTKTKGHFVDLIVHGFPRTRKLFRGETRWRVKIIFCFDSEDLSENERMAKEWKQKIIIQSRKIIQKKYGWYQEGIDPTADPQRYLVLINPVGGKGKAVNLYHSQIRPLFELADAKCDVIITKHAGHAESLIKDYDLSSIDAIIIAAGDGVLYEVVNGIMGRPDWANAITTPIGILPVGSGNALCSSLLYEAREEYSLGNAVFQILCGAISPMDVLTAHTTIGKKYFTLLYNWGMIADIDIESEKYRRIGETRFIIGALSCIFKKRIYHGKLSYLPKETNTDGLEVSPNDCNSTEIPNHNCSDKPVAIEQSSATVGDAGDSVNHVESPKNVLSTNGPPTPLISNSLSDPVPGNWVVMDDDFININVSTVPFMGHDFFATKRAHVGCGTVYIIYTEAAGTRRTDLLKMMDKIPKGIHTEMNMVHLIEAKAFRIEPADGQGIVTLDGEVIPYGPLQAQIHPQMGRVLGRRTKPQ